EYVLEVTKKGASKPLTLTFGGPQMEVTGEIEALRVTGDRLLVVSEGALGIFDLSTGQRSKFVLTHDDPALSPDGKRVAYKEFQPRYTPPEAATTIVRVLDVPTLETSSVFPERSEITSGPNGGLIAWQGDPLLRHSVGKLFWSPEGQRLLFFCKHGGDTVS